MWDAFIGYGWQSEDALVFLDIGLLEAIALLLVDYAEVDGDEQGGDAKSGEHDQGPGVVELVGSSAFNVGLVEDDADKSGEETKSDVLNPEDGCVGRTDNLLVDQLGHRGP